MREGKTYTAVRTLTDDERATELARITYGADFTAGQTAAMREMIAHAAAQKKES